MSSYRDERAALQKRVEVLEEDLRDARGKAEQVEALGRDAADKQKEIDKLRAKLAKYETPRQPATRPAAVALLALLVLCAAGGAAAFLLARRPAATPPPFAATTAVAATTDVAPGDELPEPCEAYFRENRALRPDAPRDGADARERTPAARRLRNRASPCPRRESQSSTPAASHSRRSTTPASSTATLLIGSAKRTGLLRCSKNLKLASLGAPLVTEDFQTTTAWRLPPARRIERASKVCLSGVQFF